MTWIVQGAKTKKHLQQLLNSPAASSVSFEDPSIFSPQFFNATDLPVGFRLVCTNHPKRSWFAQVERKATGFSVK